VTEDRDTLAARLLAEHDAACAELAVLTTRQRECLTLVAKGYGYKQAGEAMGVTLHAARAHMRLVCRALDCNATEAVVLAAQARWV
jgi:DNA-binding CsgD family transcriptional regulator